MGRPDAVAHKGKRQIALLLCGLALTSIIAPIATASQPAVSQPEIEYLLGVVGASPCRFYRNGIWYTGEEARSHLKEKLDIVNLRSPLQTAEQFIEKVATKSALTGIRYQIQCAGSEAAPVADWLHQELRHHRRCGAAALLCVNRSRSPGALG